MKIYRSLMIIAVKMFASVITSLAQSADALVAKHLAATGGAANWKKVKNVTMKGVFSASGTSMDIENIIVQDKGARLQYASEGMTGYQIITPKSGWNAQATKAGPVPEEMTPEQLDDVKYMLDIMPLVDYAAKGTKLSYLGKIEKGGVELEQLQLTFANGKEQIWSFDKDYNHVRTINKHVLGVFENNETFIYCNFKMLRGVVVTPMTWESGNDGKIEFKTIEINKTINESTFAPLAR